MSVKTLFLPPLFLLTVLLLGACTDMESPVPPIIELSGIDIGGVVQDGDGVPLTERTVELVRVDESGNVIDDDLGQTVTGADGSYEIENPPEPVDSSLVVRVLSDAGLEIDMNAIVSGETVDINPVAEHVYQSVLAEVTGGAAITNFESDEILGLYGLLISLDPEIVDNSLNLEPAGEALYERMLASFATQGQETVLLGTTFGVVDFMTELWDPALLENNLQQQTGGLVANATRNGIGNLSIGNNRNIVTTGTTRYGQFRHDLDTDGGVVQESPDGGFEDTLVNLLHVPTIVRELIIASSTDPQFSVAGPGALTENGSLMIYPIDARLPVVDDLEDSRLIRQGVRFAASWDPQQVPEEPLLDLTEGDGGTRYNFVQLSNRMSGDPDNSVTPNGISIVTTTGTFLFTSQTDCSDGSQFGQEDCGDATYDPVSIEEVTLNLSGVMSELVPETETETDWGFVVQPGNAGQMQLTDGGGVIVGNGVATQDGSIFGLTISPFDVSAEPGEEGVQQSLIIAVRQPDQSPSIDGTYNLLEYTIYLEGEVESGTIRNGYRFGAVEIVQGEFVTPPETGFVGKRASFDVDTQDPVSNAESIELVQTIASLGQPNVPASGRVEMTGELEWSNGLTVVAGNGAVSADGAFVVLATEVQEDVTTIGRGLLFLIRQPD